MRNPVSSRTRTPSGSPSDSTTILEVVANRVGVPFGPAHQILDAVGIGVADLLGDLPGVLSLDRSEQADEVKLALVNVNLVKPRRVIVKAGGSAEHRFTSVLHCGREVPTDRPQVAVHLARESGRAWS